MAMASGKTVSAHELALQAIEGRPNVRYAYDAKSDAAVGAWVESMGRWVMVAGRLITGEWASMPYELLVNGEPVPHSWVEAGKGGAA